MWLFVAIVCRLLLQKSNGANGDLTTPTQPINEGHLLNEPNLPYTRGITPKRVTSGGAHLRGVAPEQHCSEETSHCVRYDLPGVRTHDLPHR